ncbi:MAG TPA: DUF2339 domain-containing protein [Chitinophagaceae bacterium]|jgi:uncharacterized membrane protein|nr:DUF2339 domain-containing protein [Chitinophagaceae bacterium]
MNAILLVIAFIVLIYFLVTILNRSEEQGKLLKSLHDKINQLKGEITELSSKLKEGKTVDKPTVDTAAQVKPIPKPVEEKKEEAVKPKPVEETKKPVVPTTSFAEPTPAIQTQATPVSNKKKEDTDIEKFIGENLANKIGIAVLVLGISFFVKYAIDKNWINEVGRVAVGLVAGGILIGFAHYLRNSYRAFSSVLVGGGLAVFYFTIGFAFHQYQLIGQTTAFIIMVLISAMGVMLSVYYNRQELALLATIGGFITPFLVSTGQENYIALFTYLCILNAGLMALAWFKRWPAINITGLFFTLLIYGGWVVKRVIYEEESGMPYRDAFFFATIFYLLFVVMNILNTLRVKGKFTAFDFIILFSVNALYYIGGMMLLAYWDNSSYDGWFTAGIGLFNLILAGIFYKQKWVDRNFVFLLLGLSISFFSLVAPVLFDANYVVLCWAAQSVVMYWLYLQSGIKLLKVSSLVLSLLMMGGVLINWLNVYVTFSLYTINTRSAPMPVVFNKGFITAVAAIIALFLQYYFSKKDKSTDKPSALQQTLLAGGIVFTYLTVALEIQHQFSRRSAEPDVYFIYWQAWTCIATIVLLRAFRNDKIYPSLRYWLTAVCFVLYALLIAKTNLVSVALVTSGNGLLFSIHWLGAGMLLWLLYELVRFNDADGEKLIGGWKNEFPWIVSVAGILVLSSELYQLFIWTQYEKAEWAWWQNLYYKAGLTILWAVCSFALMWIGMKKGIKTARIISLTLFTITLVKLFAYDIRNIPPGGKIAAFILLGVLLLAVSFMYQRLKKIIMDNDVSRQADSGTGNL